MIRKISAVFIALMLTLLAVPADAQIGSNIATVNLSATVSESLTVTATPGSITFSSAGVASGPISITSTYNVVSTASNFAVVAYFSSTSALTGGANTITTSQIFGSMNGGPTTACNGSGDLGPIAQLTNACPRAAAGLGGVFSNTRTDNLVLSIPGLSGAVPPGTYTGVLNIQAAIW